MHILALKMEGRNITPHLVAKDDIIYFKYENDKIMIHTEDDEFFFPTNLNECAAFEGFEMLDRAYVGNLGKGIYDDNKKIVSYSGGKYCTVSGKHIKRLKLDDSK